MITPKITNLGYSNLWTDMSTILGYASNFDQQIQKLFANGEQGFAYDPNDLTTLYQDAAWTIPVTAAGQPVGLMLDKSKGLVLGGELFNDATVVLSGGVARESSGVYLIDTPDAIQYISIPLPIKGRYLLDFEILSLDYGTLRIDATGILSSYRYNSTGRFIQYVSHLRDLSFIAIARDSYPTKARIRVNSIRQVLGNHAYQTVSASRPLLVAAPQRLDYDAVDDKLITNLPTQLTGCTVIRAVPNVGTQILMNQTIPTSYNDNTDNCRLIVINRALTASETSQITRLFNKSAGV